MSDNEIKIIHRIHRLRDFYNDLILYGLVNLGLIVIWALSGGGYFWPIWVIIGWGIGFVRRALELNMIPTLDRLLPHLSEDWEKEQLRAHRLKQKTEITDGGLDDKKAAPSTPKIPKGK